MTVLIWQCEKGHQIPSDSIHLKESSHSIYKVAYCKKCIDTVKCYIKKKWNPRDLFEQALKFEQEHDFKLDDKRAYLQDLVDHMSEPHKTEAQLYLDAMTEGDMNVKSKSNGG